MKLSAHHKAIGDSVEWYFPLLIDEYDKIYASTVFEFSDKSQVIPEHMVVGGTGWTGGVELAPEIEALQPDYSLYNYPHNIGFTMRGCRLKCPFCVVPEKEGAPKHNNTIEEIWQQRGSDFVVLLDNDFFGNPNWRECIDAIRKHNLRVNFCQGINIRNLKVEQAEALASVRFVNASGKYRQVYFAWDDPRHEKLIHKGIQRCFDAGIKPYQMAFYVLIGYWSTIDQDLHRVKTLTDYGCDPFVMPFDKTDYMQRKFARWVNHKALFNSVSWRDYFGPMVKKKYDDRSVEMFE